MGVEVYSYVVSIGGVGMIEEDPMRDAADYRPLAIEMSELRCPDEEATEAMKARIDEAKEFGQSLGGTFRVVVNGLLPALGGFEEARNRLTSKLGGALFSIPAIKGVEFGIGFKNAEVLGHEAHDEIYLDKKKGFMRRTNRAGGLEGGMTTGMPLIMTAAMKPIPTQIDPLNTVNIDTLEVDKASTERSDVCAVPAASVVAEAEVAFIIAQAYLDKFGSDNMTVSRRTSNHSRSASRPCRAKRGASCRCVCCKESQAHRWFVPHQRKTRAFREKEDLMSDNAIPAGGYRLTKPVFFIGFMGAGKTSVSQQLAVQYGLASIDADEYLELREDRIIADIFAEDGEEAFRDIETDVLRDLSQRSPRLIGCGGGVVTKRAENAEIMRDAGYVIYLQVTADEAARRIPNTDSRPMFKNLETARKTIVERIPQYEAAAHYAIDTEGREIIDLAREIAEQLLAEGIMVKEEAHE